VKIAASKTVNAVIMTVITAVAPLSYNFSYFIPQSSTYPKI
jgi:hypothetical protein